MEMADPMNASDSDLLDYALGQLEGPARDEVERQAAADPALAADLDKLTRSVQLLLDDGEALEAPPDLARRTLAYVAEHRRRRTILDFVPAKVPFRWTDVAVAAGIFLASLLTLIPALQRSRDRFAQAGCGFNLRSLGVGLAQYATLHGHYPYTPAGQPRACAGTFAMTLNDSGLLHDPSALDCPCNGPSAKAASLPHLDGLEQLQARTPQSYRTLFDGWDYAYHAGYRRETGEAGPVPLHARVPLIADRPDYQSDRILDGNSPNHGGRGQNVLFTDGHVNWHNTRRVSPLDPDVFLNQALRPGPGLNVHDAALVPGVCPFSGW
jgi:prepilin-type processing-associated H-X9-DG protein